jgi:hypothetical protein
METLLTKFLLEPVLFTTGAFAFAALARSCSSSSAAAVRLVSESVGDGVDKMTDLDDVDDDDVACSEISRSFLFSLLRDATSLLRDASRV